MAIDCGEISFAATPPAVFEATSSEPLVPICCATEAVKEVGKESELLKMTLRYSIGLLVFICIWTFILSFIL